MCEKTVFSVVCFSEELYIMIRCQVIVYKTSGLLVFYFLRNAHMNCNIVYIKIRCQVIVYKTNGPLVFYFLRNAHMNCNIGVDLYM